MSLAVVLCWYLVLKLITSTTASVVAAVFSSGKLTELHFSVISYCFSVTITITVISCFSVTVRIRLKLTGAYFSVITGFLLVTINWNNIASGSSGSRKLQTMRHIDR